jgi:hypothetical protein
MVFGKIWPDMWQICMKIKALGFSASARRGSRLAPKSYKGRF